MVHNTVVLHISYSFLQTNVITNVGSTVQVVRMAKYVKNILARKVVQLVINIIRIYKIHINSEMIIHAITYLTIIFYQSDKNNTSMAVWHKVVNFVKPRHEPFFVFQNSFFVHGNKNHQVSNKPVSVCSQACHNYRANQFQNTYTNQFPSA